MKPYVSPGCHFSDYLEAAAVLRQISTVTYLDAAEQQQTATGKIVDIYAKDGADWCRLDSGLVLRLDQIEKFNEIENQAGACGLLV